MKKFGSAIIAIAFAFSAFSPLAQAEEKSVQLTENARSAILIERDTGQVLYEKNGQENHGSVG